MTTDANHPRAQLVNLPPEAPMTVALSQGLRAIGCEVQCTRSEEDDTAPWVLLRTPFPYATHADIARRENDKQADDDDDDVTMMSQELGTSFCAWALMNDMYEFGGSESAEHRIAEVAEDENCKRCVCVAIGVRQALGSQINPSQSHTGIQAYWDTAAFDEFICTLLAKFRVDTVEVATHAEAVAYVTRSVQSIQESRTKKLPSHYKARMRGPATLDKELDGIDQHTWVAQLMQIPGVSEEVAKSVARRHASCKELADALEEQGSAALEDITIVATSGGQRSLGKGLSARIMRVFLLSADPGGSVV